MITDRRILDGELVSRILRRRDGGQTLCNIYLSSEDDELHKANQPAHQRCVTV